MVLNGYPPIRFALEELFQSVELSQSSSDGLNPLTATCSLASAVRGVFCSHYYTHREVLARVHGRPHTAAWREVRSWRFCGCHIYTSAVAERSLSRRNGPLLGLLAFYDVHGTGSSDGSPARHCLPRPVSSDQAEPRYMGGQRQSYRR